ncbi:hypothetical protein KIH79_08630, partial [Bifidobacterium sp. 82T10]
MPAALQMIADRWMMESRRLVNWGSYEGYHEFRPSMDKNLPVTLLAGASESGKSTLVDAQVVGPVVVSRAGHAEQIRVVVAFGAPGVRRLVERRAGRVQE